MFSKINQFFKKYPWIPNITMSVIGVIVSIIIFFVNSNITGVSKELLESVREIRSNTSTLADNLKHSTNGGITVIVGVNPREIKENLAYIYDNNDLNLKAGDVIILKNFTDNTYQSSLRFIIQKSLPNPEIKNKSTAAIFISEDAAKRLGFEDYKTKGTVVLKMQRMPTKEIKE